MYVRGQLLQATLSIHASILRGFISARLVELAPASSAQYTQSVKFILFVYRITDMRPCRIWSPVVSAKQIYSLNFADYENEV